ncbi:nucleoside-diphosphate sugar epimerase/dehydratase [Microvirga thermotolerans]|uniref:SDR family NAD(P)-dependent oxidoreductase n=1 Tax=Microvirga thermotolerans TaxID=2651334 RepID=A0A5P9JZF7_9HYPH|nr:nucleoside-diphosphate sugar epimerase/dehydratase [Microvirga thermotolerans]QFU17977.1 SDR family NAD(P)-dependent oxidoreductase [Microvirga thermotolerans]
MTRQDFKKVLIVVHDLAMTAAAVLATFFVRFDGALLDERLRLLPMFLPPFVAFAGIVYWFFQLYRSKWRFASLPDLFNIFRASTVLALTLLVIDYVLVSPQLLGAFFFGKITIALYWLVQMFLLGGPRLAFRYVKYARSRNTIERDANTPTLLLGRGSDTEVVLRAIESGAVKRLQPKGVLSYRSDELGQSIRGVPVLGTFADLDRVIQEFQERGVPIRRLVATPSALAPEAHPEMLLARARRLGLPLVRVTSLGEGMRDAELAPLEIEDLLLRPTVQIDRHRLENFIRGKRVLVTGGGGSIGSEICTRVVAFGASRLLILESSEPSLHHILENPTLLSSDTEVDGVLADVRDRERVHEIMNDFRPDVVFHAAALKHVPYLERNWTEGIKTNVFGSVNVADAAVEVGASAIVIISTDKAIDPVSMLGATKRFAEMYGQALDAEFMGRNRATRLIAVRFGNVLGSVGSVVPKFKAQIARGGPVTVTHPDMVRYFMTTREAADLVLTSASHADAEGRTLTDGANSDERTSIYVLKMGQPVRIYELAERMIRLAGYEPGEEIEIAVTGTRPGERLHEILFAREEPRAEIGIDGVMAARPIFADRARLESWLERLAAAVREGDRAAAEAVFEEAIPEFKRRTKEPPPAAPARLASQ